MPPPTLFKKQPTYYTLCAGDEGHCFGYNFRGPGNPWMFAGSGGILDGISRSPIPSMLALLEVLAVQLRTGRSIWYQNVSFHLSQGPTTTTFDEYELCMTQYILWYHSS